VQDPAFEIADRERGQLTTSRPRISRQADQQLGLLGFEQASSPVSAIGVCSGVGDQLGGGPQQAVHVIERERQPW